MAPCGEEADFRPFDLLDDGLVLAIFRCLPDPESLGCAAQVNKRLAELCEEPYAWRPLLDLALSSSGDSYLALPSQGAGWRERYKQWYTLSSLEWSLCPPAAGSAQPSARSDHSTAAVSADRAYVFGGLSDQGHQNVLGDLWMLRCDSAATGTASWELVAPTSEHTPTDRNMATLSPVSLSDSAHPVGLILFGGHDEDETYINDVWLFDTRTAVWTMLLPCTTQQAVDVSVRPDARGGHSAITHNGSSEVVIFGGATDDSVLNDVLSFSVGTRQWKRDECAGANPSPRCDHTACRVAESMYIFGGSTVDGSLNDLWEYALDAHAWTQVVSAGGSAPSPRESHSLVPLSNRLMVFGGRNSQMPNLNDSALHCFDLQRRRWSDLLTVSGVFPPARAYHVAISCGGGFLVFGGRGSSDECLNDTVLLRVWP